MSLRIAQLTDLHLFEDREGVLAGVRSWETFEAVLALLNEECGDVDYLVLTGDLAQDEAEATYCMLREALGPWRRRLRLVPGNHDDPAALRKTFPECFAAGQEASCFDIDLGCWRVIGLDSHVPGEVHGRVGEAQLDWLRARLASAAEAPTALFIHHPPVPIRVEWIDDLGLEASRALLDLIEASPQVRVVCAGHVHQTFEGRIGGARMYTTPSTCVQFAARADKGFDTRPAGLRLLDLEEDGTHRTTVRRLGDRAPEVSGIRAR